MCGGSVIIWMFYYAMCIVLADTTFGHRDKQQQTLQNGEQLRLLTRLAIVVVNAVINLSATIVCF